MIDGNTHDNPSELEVALFGDPKNRIFRAYVLVNNDDFTINNGSAAENTSGDFIGYD